MKELDELIEKYKYRSDTIVFDLESLKQSIKEQHKKDVVKAYNVGWKDTVDYVKSRTEVEPSAEQYYNQNH